MPVLPLYFIFRSIRGKEILSKALHRLGFSGIEVMGDVIWIHVASVGESRSVLGFTELLLKAGFKIKITTMTLTSNKLISDYFANQPGVKVAFAPWDILPSVLFFILTTRPKKIFFVESEIWPNMLFISYLWSKNNVYLLNARMSSKSLRNWSVLLKYLRYNPFKFFRKIYLAQQSDFELFHRFNHNIKYLGNIKNDYTPIYPKDLKISDFAQISGFNNVLLASTHDREERILLPIVKNFTSARPDTRIIMAPRHPNRILQAAENIKASGLNPVLLSDYLQSTLVLTKYDVLVVDRIGAMAVFYDIATIVVTCGSFVSGIGGHNPLEPIYHRKPTIVGNYHENCRETVKLLSAEGLLEISDANDLMSVLNDVSLVYDDIVDKIGNYLNRSFNVSQKVYEDIFKK